MIESNQNIQIQRKRLKEEKNFTLFICLNYFTYVIQNKSEYDSYQELENEEYNNFDINSHINKRRNI